MSNLGGIVDYEQLHVRFMSVTPNPISQYTFSVAMLNNNIML